MNDKVLRFECEQDDFAVESSDETEVVSLAQMHAIVKHEAKIPEISTDESLKS